MSEHANTFNRKLGRTLRFKAKYIDMLLSGEKVTTIRRGIVTPTRDEVFLESDGKIYGTARVKSVRYTKVSELNSDDAVRDGFADKEDLKKALKEIYPDLKDDEWVTIIFLEDVNRFSSPLPLEALQRDIDFERASRIAQLALAHGVLNEKLARQVLARVALSGDVKDAARKLGVDENKVKIILAKAVEELRKRGVEV
ncbi:ASCH domain-containing protein [Thermofilum pendens]|uniref:ASCH domain-containing protein n=1 Tax=Thermofilum pendens (strain DSM 2475 / Hrk 5) TaxID=368408 RepID=A1RYK7_THEPD|nr:ASCH domain-containing protein [Thermofilum pendens]ABL78287.1 protein of unknown function DUF437 [Thermofilum pendens Hrk 5]